MIRSWFGEKAFRTLRSFLEVFVRVALLGICLAFGDEVPRWTIEYTSVNECDDVFVREWPTSRCTEVVLDSCHVRVLRLVNAEMITSEDSNHASRKRNIGIMIVNKKSHV